MVQDYSKIARQMESHPFFGRYQRALSCPQITLEGKTLEDVIFRRSDPFGNHSVRISTTRSLKPRNINDVALVEKPSSQCIFCYPLILEKITEPKIVHASVNTGGFTPITSYNPYGIDGVSMVTIFTSHKTKLKEFTFDDMAAYMETLYETAHFLKERHQAKGMWEFMNWGPLAGASQEHPHVQRGTTPEDSSEEEEKEILRKNVVQQELEQVQKLTKKLGGKDPFEVYLEAVRKSPYFIWESSEPDGVLICAPSAPSYPHGVDVIPKQKIDTILKLTNREQRIRIARSMLGVFQALEERLNVTDLNVALHQGFFNEDNGNYRLHWHFYPRNHNRWAGMEAGHGVIVLPFFPEETADQLYEHYHHRRRSIISYGT